MSEQKSTQNKPAVKLNMIESFFISGSAAIISKTAAAPIERIKLLVQNQGEMLKNGLISEPYKAFKKHD